MSSELCGAKLAGRLVMKVWPVLQVLRDLVAWRRDVAALLEHAGECGEEVKGEEREEFVTCWTGPSGLFSNIIS